MKFSLVAGGLLFSVGVSGGFAPQLPQHRLLSPIATGSALGMAKKLKNKQAQMLEKMKAAKRQAGKDDESSTEVSADAAKGGRLSDEEIKERNDRLRFEELLKKQSSTASIPAKFYQLLAARSAKNLSLAVRMNCTTVGLNM